MTDRILLVMGVPAMIRDVARRSRGSGGCRACRILGQVPCGPPYWLLRAHLRRAGRGNREQEPPS